MKASTIAAGLAAAVLAFAAGAQAQDVRSLAPGAAPAPATLQDLKGLFGSWAAKDASAAFSAPMGGQVVGHLALYNADGTPRVQEIWIFRPEGASVGVRQKHYTPDLKDREEKDAWGQRKLVALDAGHVYLENLTWVTKGDELGLIVRIGGQNGAAPTMLNYTFHRVK